MTKIYAYFEDNDNFRLTTIKKWEHKLTVASAKKYLRNHLLKSLQNDFSVAFDAYKNKVPQDAGYFALPRIIFPYITFLGSLYKGTNTTESALRFMVDYMGQVSKEYKIRAGIDYFSYRHGLLHTDMPKFFSFGKRKLGWWISFAESNPDNRGDCLYGKLLMYPRLFYEDLYNAIELYISDFCNPRKQKCLFASFKKGFEEMAKIYLIKNLKAGKFGKALLRKGLKKYSL